MSHYITIKLDGNDFLSWKQQVEGIIHTHKPQAPSSCESCNFYSLIVANRISNTENPTYLAWELDDSLLFTWLPTMQLDFVLPRVTQCVQALQVWRAINVFYKTQIDVKSRQLHTELNPGNVAFLLYCLPKHGIKKIS